MTQTLNDLLSDFQALDELDLELGEQLAGEGGELTPEAEEKLALTAQLRAEIEGATVEKLDRATHYLKHLEAEEASHKAKADVWQAKADAEAQAAKRLASRREWLRGLMFMAVDRMVQPDEKGRVRLQTANFLLWVKPTTSSEVKQAPGLDPFALPRHLVKCEVSKSAVKEAAKAGETLPEGLLVEPKVSFSLQVK